MERPPRPRERDTEHLLDLLQTGPDGVAGGWPRGAICVAGIAHVSGERVDRRVTLARLPVGAFDQGAKDCLAPPPDADQLVDPLRDLMGRIEVEQLAFLRKCRGRWLWLRGVQAAAPQLLTASSGTGRPVGACGGRSGRTAYGALPLGRLGGRVNRPSACLPLARWIPSPWLCGRDASHASSSRESHRTARGPTRLGSGNLESRINR